MYSEVGEGSKGKKKSEPKSKVWEHFTKEKVNGDTKAKCNFCNDYLSYKYGNTSTLGGHIASCNAAPKDVRSEFSNLYKRNHNKRAALDVQPPTIPVADDVGNFSDSKCVPTNDPKESCSEVPREVGTRSSGKHERENAAQPLKKPRREMRAATDGPLTVGSGDEARYCLTPEKMREVRVKDAILANLPFAPPNIKEAWRSSMVMDMEKEVCAYYQREKKKLVAELGNLTSEVCFSIEIVGEDRWISITAHFINDDYNLGKKLIGFKKFPDRELFNNYEYRKEVRNIVESCLSDWKLFKNKRRVAALSTHRLVDLDKRWASMCPPTKLNLDWKYTLCFKSYLEKKILVSLKEVFRSEKGRFVKLFQDVLQTNCNSWFNLIARREKLPPINEAWLTGLPEGWAAEDAWSTGGLPIRWSVGTKDWECCCHIVKIFKYALSYKEVFSQFALNKMDGRSILEINPECIDWRRLKKEVDYFDSINSIIDSLSNFEYPTSNQYHQICTKANDSVEAFIGFKCLMEYEYDIFHVACVLDPRYKLKWFKYLFKKIYRCNGRSIIKRIRRLIEVQIGVLKKGEAKFPNANTQDQQDDDPSSSSNEDRQEDKDDQQEDEDDQQQEDSCSDGSTDEDQQEDEDDQQEDSSSDCPTDEESSSTFFDGFCRYIKKRKTTNISELDLYLEEETVDYTGDTPFDLLGWWKENSLRYPALSRLARNVLAMPACVYNVEENLKLDLRVLEGASSELVEAAICSTDWILSDVQSLQGVGQKLNNKKPSDVVAPEGDSINISSDVNFHTAEKRTDIADKAQHNSNEIENIPKNSIQEAQPTPRKQFSTHNVPDEVEKRTKAAIVQVREKIQGTTLCDKFGLGLNNVEILAVEFVKRIEQTVRIAQIEGNDTVCLTGEKMNSLVRGDVEDGTARWLCDEIIDAYINIINHRNVINQEKHPSRKTLIVSTVQTQLLQGDKWTTRKRKLDAFRELGTNILDNNLVFFPIHDQDRQHWFLLVLNRIRGESQILDSMAITYNYGSPNPYDGKTSKLRSGIQQCVRIAYNSNVNVGEKWKEVAEWPVCSIQVPQQMDVSSCGLFTIKCIEHWDGWKFEEKFSQDGMELFRKRMVRELIMSELNLMKIVPQEIKKLLTEVEFSND